MTAESSFILQELHLYNWGAFAGRHQIGIDPGNSAIIGPTGSGKTTLVDALMTLLCASPRYNLASTGGHESDRDLVSYVRGASGQGNDSGDHIARAGRCATGIAARLVRGDESVWLGALLWFDGSSQSAADMQKRWFFAQGEGHSLDLWLEEQHSGGARALTRLAKDSEGLQMFSSKAPYLAKLHSFFEVGPNAFTLLNRAAGLKQLNSIDEIFRELVLDDQSAFIATLGGSRTPRMRDVLGTIQADQDAIVRAGSRGVLVVDGGPGTGKTVVALHRAAFDDPCRLLRFEPRRTPSPATSLPRTHELRHSAPSSGYRAVVTCTCYCSSNWHNFGRCSWHLTKSDFCGATSWPG